MLPVFAWDFHEHHSYFLAPIQATSYRDQATLFVGILNSPAISVVWYYLIGTSAVSIFFHAHAHLNSITQLLYYFQTHGAWYEIVLHQPVCRCACLDVCLNMEWLQYVSLVFRLHTFGVEMIVFICLPFFESCLYLRESCASHICWFSSREARDYEIDE